MIVIFSGQKDKGICEIGIHIRLIFKAVSWLIEIAFIESPYGIHDVYVDNFFLLMSRETSRKGQSDSEYAELNFFAAM